MAFSIKNTGVKGDPDIYPEQEQTAKLIHQHFLAGRNQVELRADCQQGKTGTIYCLMNECALSAQANGADIFVLYLICQSSLDLKRQTSERISKSEDQHGSNFGQVKWAVLHQGDALSYVNARGNRPFSPTASVQFAPSRTYRPNGDYLLVVLDESHISAAQNSMVDQFLACLGIRRGANPSTWANKRAWLTFVSATDFGNQVLRLGGGSLAVVDMVKSPKYYGTPDLLSRAQPRSPKDKYFNASGVLSQWMTDTVLPAMKAYIEGPFQARNIDPGSNELLVPTARFRVSSVKEGNTLRNALERWARNNGFQYPEGIVFHSGGKGDAPISDLKSHDRRHNKRGRCDTDILFLIVIDAAAAGTTIDLETTCLAVEALPPKNGIAVDSKLVQEAGRYLGYHNWRDFPVFLYKPSLELFSKYLAGESCVPSATGVSSHTPSAQSNSCKYKFAIKDSPEYVRLLEENSAFVSTGLSKISENNAQYDLADYVINNKAYSGGGTNYRSIGVDGSSTKYPVSWRMLVEKLRREQPQLFDGQGYLKENVVAIPTEIGIFNSAPLSEDEARNLLAANHSNNRQFEVTNP